jgi:hypothetical protein
MEDEMVIDQEIVGELDVFLDDALLQEFANDQGQTVEWRIESVAGRSCCTITLDRTPMPPVIAHDDQTALDNASVQTIELLTRGDPALEPQLAFA